MNSIKGILFIHLIYLLLVVPAAITFAAIPTSSNSQVTIDEDLTVTFVEGDFPFADIDGHTLSGVRISTLPSLGVLQLNGVDVAPNQVIPRNDILNGDLKYYPVANGNGTPYTSFQFSVIDTNTEESSVSTLSINVNPQNDSPSAESNLLTLNEDNTLIIIPGDFNFSDLDGHSFSKIRIETTVGLGSLKNGATTLSNGSEVLFADLNSNQFTYTPPLNGNGSPYTECTFRVFDSSGDFSSIYTLSFNVTSINDLPTSANVSPNIPEDNAKIFASSDFPFTDTDGGSFTQVRISELAISGSLQFNLTDVAENQIIATSNLGNLVFTPVPNANGNNYASFKFEVYDGTNYSASKYSFVINVTPDNDPPTIAAVPDPAAIYEDAGIQTINLTGISAGSGETESLTVTVASTNTMLINPVISYNNTNGTGTVTYAPAANLSGVATVTVTINDGTLSVQESWLVTVLAVNDPPTINTIGTQTTLENQPITIPITGISAGLLESGQVITITANSDNDALVPDGVVSYTQGSNTGSITFTPASNISGNVTITVMVTDDGGNSNPDNNNTSITFQLQVQSVNNAPTLSDITNPVPVNEDTSTQNVALTGIGDGDPEVNQTLTISAASTNTALVETFNVSYTQGESTATVSYALKPNAYGSATVNVTVSDGDGQIIKSFTVVVNPVNDEPTIDPIGPVAAINEDAPQQTIILSGISPGPNEASQTVTVSATSSLPGVIPNPVASYNSGNQQWSITYTPVTDEYGSVIITVTVTDNDPNQKSTAQSFTQVVLPANDLPTIDPIGNLAINEDAGLQTVVFGGVTDDGEPPLNLSVSAVSSNTGLIPNPTLNYTSPNASGSLQFTPTTNAFGAATITVRVTDKVGAFKEISFSVSVANINDAPTLADIPAQAAIAEDAGLQTIALSGISAGPGGEPESITAVALSDNTLLINSPTVSIVGNSGTLRYTPIANANGTAVLTVRINDGQASNNITEKTVTINVLAVNDAPVFTILGDQAVSENSGVQTINGFAQNIDDGDPEVQSLTFQTDVLGVTGNLVFENAPTIDLATGNLSYKAAANTNGNASMKVTLRDNGGTANGGINQTERTFTIIVTAVNEPPTFTLNGNPPATNEDAGLVTVAAFAQNMSDGDPDLVQAIDFILNQISGTLTFGTPPDIDPVTGTLTYQAGPNQNGTAIFNVILQETVSGKPSISQQFTITVNPVNDPPTGSDETVALMEDTPYTFSSGDFTLTDIDSHTFAGIQVISLPVLGTLTYNGSNVTPGAICPTISLLVYTPAPDGSGAPYTTFTFKVRDNSGDISVATYSMRLDVTPVSDNPTGASNDVNTAEDQPFTFAISDFPYDDPDNDAFGGIIINANVSKGSLLENSVVISAFPKTVTDVTKLVFQPAAGQSGTPYTSFNFDVRDINGSVSGTGGTYTISISVGAVNDPPVGGDKTVTILEDIPYTLQIADFPFSDLDGHSFAGVQITQLASSGILVYNGSPINVLDLCPDVTKLVYTPAANQNGTAIGNFKFKVLDNSTELNTSVASYTFTFNGTAVNDAPLFTITGNPPAINEDDGAQTIIGLASSIDDGDPDLTQTLTFTCTPDAHPTLTFSAPPTINSTTGNLTYTPNANAYGTVNVIVSLNDNGGTANGGINQSAQQQFTITVNPINDLPTLTDIASPVNVNEDATAFIIDLAGIGAGTGENQTLALDAISSNPAIIPNPTKSYTSPNTTGQLTLSPVPNTNGSVTISVTINDGGSTNNFITKTFQVNVASINDPPTLSAIPDPAAINEDAGLQTINLSGITAGGNESQPLVVTASSSNTALIPTPVISYTSPDNIGSLSYTPAPNQSGTSIITVTVRDNGSTNFETSRTFTVSVAAVNDPPTLSDLPPAPIVINEDASIQTLLLTGISAGNGETQTLTVTAISDSPTIIPNPTIGTISGGQATLSYQPVTNMSGNVKITVTVNDGGSTNNLVSKDFFVNVTPVNDPPTLSPVAGTPFTISEDATVQTVNLSGISAGGGETQTLVVTATSGSPLIIPNPTVSYVQGAATATLSYTPVVDKSGSVTITVTVDDLGSSNNTVTQQFVVNVQSINDFPTLNNIVSPITVNEDELQQTVALSGISSGGGEVQVVTVSAVSLNPTIVGNPIVNYSGNNSATLLFTPVANASGNAVIEVTVNDGQAVNNLVKKSFTVEVLKVNDPPTLAAITSPVNITEDAALQTITITGISPGPNEAEQSVTITAVSNNVALIPNPTVNPKDATSRDLTFTPLADKNGTATITVTVNDGEATNNTFVRTFIVNVQAANDKPIFNLKGDVAVNENSGPQTVTAQATAIDDGDAELTQSLTFDLTVTGGVVFTTPPALSVSNGNLTFETAPNSNGVSNVTVTLTDNGIPSQSTVKTFVINVLAVNGKPSFSLSGNPPAVNEDAVLQTVTTFATAINDGDPELNQTLSFTLTKVSGSLNFASNPQINASTGNLTYQSALNSTGTATFNVTLSDNGGEISTVQTITITVNPVNDPPVGQDEAVNTNEDIAYQFKTGDFTYSDAELNSFSGIQIVSLETSGDLEYNGTDVVLNQECSNVALLVYRPSPNSVAPAEFSFKLIDSQGAVSTTYKMSITISSIEDNPVSGSAEVSSSENAIYTFIKEDFPFTDADAGATFATVRIFSLETRGDLEYNGVDVAVGTEVSNFALLKFIPAPSENGSPYATFRFQVKDNSGLLSSDNIMSINVGSVNDRPIGANGKVVTLEDQPYTFKVSDFTFSDPDLDLFDGVRIESMETAGDLEYDGADISNLPALCPDLTKLIFKPDANLNGAPYATFTFKVKDTSASLNLSSANYTMTIDVTAVNDAPVFNINGNPPAINEDAGNQTITDFATAINDGDQEIAQTIQFSSPEKTGGTGNLTFQTAPKIDLAGTLTYQPTANTFGTSVFNIYLTDNGGTANGGIAQSQVKSFTITVNAVNDQPTITAISDRPPIAEDAQTITINLSNISAGPLESQPIVVTAVSSNTGMIPNPTITYSSPNSTGSISYKPVADKSGTATVTVTVSDSEAFNGTVSTTFNVTVTPINDPPTINDIVNPAPIAENAGEQIVEISGLSAGGGEVQDILVTAVSSNTALIPNPISIAYSGGSTAQIIYTPVKNQSGESTITLTINDQNGGITAKTFKVTVSPVNDPPTLAPVPNPVAILEDASQQQITLTGISAGTNESQVLSLSGTSSNTSLIQISPASFVYTSPNTTGILRYQPIANRYGTAIITVSVSDGISSVNQQFTVEVKPVADTPSVTNASANQGEQSTTGLVVSRNPEDGTEVMYFKITNIMNGTLYLQDGITQVVNGEFLLFAQANAGLRFTPASTVDGSFEVQSSLTNIDSGIGGAKAKATIFLNTNPTTTNIPDQTVNEDSPQLVFDLFQAFSDKEDPDSGLKFTVNNSSPDLIRTTITGQKLYIDLLSNKNGTAFLTVICTDTKGAFVEDNITLTITPINDKPIFSSTPTLSVNQDETYSYLVTTVDAEDNQRSIIALAPTWLGMFDKGDGTATLSGKPDQSAVGAHQVEITVRETVSGLFEKQIYTLTVVNVNDAPEIVSTPPTEVSATDRYYYEIEVEDADPDQGYTVQIDEATRPDWLVLSENAPYSLEGYPPEVAEGVYTITLIVTDAGGLSSEQVYQLTVLPMNKRPTLGRIDPILILENQTYTFTSLMFTEQFNDDDPGDEMEFITITELPLNGELQLNGSAIGLNDTILTSDLNNLEYHPNRYYTGLDYFYWNASDGKAMSLNASIVNISINPVSDPPEILMLENEAAIFYYGEPALVVTETAEVYEYDNGLISSASIAITSNYNSSQDSLYLPSHDGITIIWNDTTGVLTISGIKSDFEYQDMLHSVRYINNKRYSPDSKKRTITIIVSDGGLESVPVTRDIIFEDTFINLDVPTGFTPNGDGANDTWEIGNIDIHEDVIVRIFTREGIRVYESIGYYTPWDGVYNGSVLKPGVYYYTIEVKKYERRFSGTITLLR